MRPEPPETLPDLTALQLLVALARHGTVTRAAASLHLSQPAATHQLRRLERQLGVALLERRGRGVALTAAGQAAVGRAARALEELAALGRDMRALAGLEAGHVRVGAGSTASIHLLPAWLATFRQRWPGVTVHLREAGTPEVLDALVAGDLDLGVVGLPAARRGVAITPWCEDPVAFLAWPGAPLAARPIAAADLTGAPFIHARAGSPIRAIVDAGLAAAGVAPREVMSLESVEAIKACVAAGLGYAAVSSRSAAADLAAGRLVPLAPAGLSLTRRFGLAVREGAAPVAAVQALLGLLGEAP
ncbi:MAG: LysR family transcriptional regulator [Candidatus Sericytochromatia bacterium]|nr:LysR family transcriptional regulator [Candidatus Sericytochromatia bacterium]